MDDLQRMTLYSESRLEDLRNQSQNAHLSGRPRRMLTRWVTFSIVVLLGALVWSVA